MHNGGLVVKHTHTHAHTYLSLNYSVWCLLFVSGTIISTKQTKRSENFSINFL